jgi:hypothetical protein
VRTARAAASVAFAAVVLAGCGGGQPPGGVDQDLARRWERSWQDELDRGGSIPESPSAGPAQQPPGPPLAEGPPRPAPAALEELFAQLRGLRVEDHPKPPDPDKTRDHTETYNRDRDWQPNGWDDGEGCDTRDDILSRDATGPVRRDGTCNVEAGTWSKVYVDGTYTGDPDVSAGNVPIQLDHVVGLSDAWQSGGWRWEPALKQRYTLDPLVLWAVDGRANEAKGDKGPDRWPPPNRAIWCLYAQRRITIKATYHLTVTSPERDATGRMLDTCREPQ